MTILDCFSDAEKRSQAFKRDEIDALARNEPEVATLCRIRAAVLEQLCRDWDERLATEIAS